MLKKAAELFQLDGGGWINTDGVVRLNTGTDTVGIGVTDPAAKLQINGGCLLSGTGRYLNFGTVAGTTGYGFRDNAGAMEYKDSGGLWTALNSLGGGGGVPAGRLINTTSPLFGGGDLSEDRTLSLQVATGAQNGYLSSTDWIIFNNKLSPNGDGSSLTGLTKSQVGLGNVENTALSTWAGTANLTTLGTVTTGVWQGTAIGDTYISSAATWNAKQSALGFTPENVANKAAANGYASLNASSKVVQDPANATATPSANKIPIADSNGLLDAWVTSAGITNITQIANRSHNDIQDIGSNNHTQLDGFVASKAAASGLASLDINSRVVQDPASVKGGSIQKIAHKWTAGATKTGDTNEASLHSWTMPANTVEAGDIIRITAYLLMTNNANNKTYRVKFGAGPTVFTQINYTTSDAAKYQTDIIVKTTTSQITCQSLSNSNGGWSTSSGSNSAAEDTTGSILINLTGQLAIGTDSISLEAVTIEVL